eukprot:Em0011g1044a
MASLGYTVYYLSLPNTSKRQSSGYTNHTFPPTFGDINNLNPNGVYQFSVVAQVTITGQLYSGEMDTSLVNTPTITPGSSNLVFWGAVLAGSLVVLWSLSPVWCDSIKTPITKSTLAVFCPQCS